MTELFGWKIPKELKVRRGKIAHKAKSKKQVRKYQSKIATARSLSGFRSSRTRLLPKRRWKGLPNTYQRLWQWKRALWNAMQSLYRRGKDEIWNWLPNPNGLIAIWRRCRATRVQTPEACGVSDSGFFFHGSFFTFVWEKYSRPYKYFYHWYKNFISNKINL